MRFLEPGRVSTAPTANLCRPERPQLSAAAARGRGVAPATTAAASASCTDKLAPAAPLHGTTRPSGSDPTSGVLPSYDDAYATGRMPACCPSAAFRTGRRFARRSIRSAEGKTTSPTSRTRSTNVRQARSFSSEPAHSPFTWPICPSRFRQASLCAAQATAAARARRTARPPSPCPTAFCAYTGRTVRHEHVQ